MAINSNYECCTGLERVNFNKMEFDLFWWTCHKPRINWSDPNLHYAIAMIMFNPIFWNCAARLEYHRKIISRLFGSARRGCIFLAVTILFLMVTRSRRYQLALISQPTWPLLESDWVWYLGTVVFICGLILAVTSFYALGIFGTYLGDYFGILMEEKVTSFPFNIMDDPMYWGSVLEHLGYAAWRGSPAGLFLTVVLCVMYRVAIAFEGPFTARIYAERDAMESKKDK